LGKESILATTIELAIFIFCMVGCGFHSWKLGKHQGIEATVQYMIDQGVLEVEE